MRYNILDFSYEFIGYKENSFLYEIIKVIDERFWPFREKNSKSEDMCNLKVFFFISRYPSCYIVKEYDERYALSKVGFLSDTEIVFEFRYPKYLIILKNEQKNWSADFIVSIDVLKKNSVLEKLEQLKDWSYLSLIENYAYSFMNMLDIIFLITNLAKERKFFLLHSSGISFNNKAYLFTGVSNIGKTSLVLKLLSELKDSKFLTEDMAYLNVKGRTVLDPRDFRVYPDVVDFNPILNKKLFKGLINYVQWQLRNFLGKNRRSVRRLVSPDELLGKKRIEYRSVKVNSIFVLLRKYNNSVIKIDKEVVKKWITLNTLDDFSIYFLAIDSIILANPKININFPSHFDLHNALLVQSEELLSSIQLNILAADSRSSMFNYILRELKKVQK